MTYQVPQKYSGKVRARTCGILIDENEILLIKHKNLGKTGILWIPPGGGIEFGESIAQNIEREFIEETGLEVKFKKHLFVHEFISTQLHALEFFVEVERVGGKLKLGTDPEYSLEDQIIESVEFFSEQRISNTSKTVLHNVFSHFSSPTEILNNRQHIQFNTD